MAQHRPTLSNHFTGLTVWSWLVLAMAVIVALLAVRDVGQTVFRKAGLAMPGLLGGSDARTELSKISLRLASKGNAVTAADSASAKAAMKQEPLSPVALRILAQDAAQRGETTRSAALFAHSNTMTRRDGYTQIALMAQATKRGEIGAALRNLDIALTTFPQLSAQVHPLLTQIIGDNAVRAQFVELLRRDRPWLTGFLIHAASATGQPDRLASALIDSRAIARQRVAEDVVPSLLAKLLANGNYPSARSLALGVPGGNAGVAQSLALDSAGVDERLGPLAWQFPELDSAGAQIAGSGKHAGIAGFAAAGYRNVVAKRMLLLSPGSYTVTLRTAPEALRNADGSVQFVLSCAVGDKAGPVPLAVSGNLLDQRNVELNLTVGPDCRAQVAELRAVGGSGSEDQQFLIYPPALSAAK